MESQDQKGIFGVRQDAQDSAKEVILVFFFSFWLYNSIFTRGGTTVTTTYNPSIKKTFFY